MRLLLVCLSCLSWLAVSLGFVIVKPQLVHNKHKLHRGWSNTDSSLSMSSSSEKKSVGLSDRLDAAFSLSKSKNSAAFVGFVTGGYPTYDDTVSILLSMQEGGCSVIELGVPYSDPQADGATIQLTNAVAIKGGTNSVEQCLDLVEQARSKGLTVPVILMGYYNPFYQFGNENSHAKQHDNSHANLNNLARSAKAKGVDGFIVVDLPPEERDYANFVLACKDNELSYVPLVAPTTTDDRLDKVLKTASSFVYCVSTTGVTGSRKQLPEDLEAFVERVRKKVRL